MLLPTSSPAPADSVPGSTSNMPLATKPMDPLQVDVVDRRPRWICSRCGMTNEGSPRSEDTALSGMKRRALIQRVSVRSWIPCFFFVFALAK